MAIYLCPERNVLVCHSEKIEKKICCKDCEHCRTRDRGLLAVQLPGCSIAAATATAAAVCCCPLLSLLLLLPAPPAVYCCCCCLLHAPASVRLHLCIKRYHVVMLTWRRVTQACWWMSHGIYLLFSLFVVIPCQRQTHLRMRKRYHVVMWPGV